MSRLAAQSIEKLCRNTKWFGLVDQTPMIQPFLSEKQTINGKSAGLSAASYDCRIAHDLELGPLPGSLSKEVRETMQTYSAIAEGERDSYTTDLLLRDWIRLTNGAKWYSLANTVEDFCIPHNVSADVADKSTWARRFVSCFNTFIDPGFYGNLTLEIVNLSEDTIKIAAGDPICQVIFTWLDRRTNRPYKGKYQGQDKKPIEPRYELENGGFTEGKIQWER